MRKLIALLFMLTLTCSIFSQSELNIPYIGTSNSIEKRYILTSRLNKNTFELVEKNEIQYNKDGTIKNKSMYESNGAYLGKIEFKYYPPQMLTEEIDYDAMNQIIKKRTNQFLFPNRDYINSTYSGNGNMIKRTTSIFDSLGQKRTEVHYNALGGIDSYDEFKIDVNGRDLEKHFYDYDGYNITNTFYRYNELGRLEESKEYGEFGKILETVEYQYDSRGNVTNIAYFRSDDLLVKREAYIYDKQGRLLVYDCYEHTDRSGGKIRLVESKKYEYPNSKKK